MATNKGSGPDDDVKPSSDSTNKDVSSSQGSLPEKCVQATPSGPSKVEPSHSVAGKSAPSASKSTAPEQQKGSKPASKKDKSAMAKLKMKMQRKVKSFKEPAKEQPKPTETELQKKLPGIAKDQAKLAAAPLQVWSPPWVPEVAEQAADPIAGPSRPQESEGAGEQVQLTAVATVTPMQPQRSRSAKSRVNRSRSASATPFEQQYSKIAAEQVRVVTAPFQEPVPPQVLEVAKPAAAPNAGPSRSRQSEDARAGPAAAPIAGPSRSRQSEDARAGLAAAPIAGPSRSRQSEDARAGPAAAPIAGPSRSRQSEDARAGPAAAPIAGPSRSRQSEDARAGPAAAPIAGPSRSRQSEDARAGLAAAPIAVPSPSRRSNGARRPTRPAAAAPTGNQEVAGRVRWFQRVQALLQRISVTTYQQSDCAAFSTHLQSLLIMDSHCFLMKSNLRPRVLILGQRLGVLVRYRGECATQSCEKCPFPGPCQVCPHMFSCSCRTKYEGTAWCAHIHVALRMKMAVYKGQMCLYVHSYDSCRVEMRHLRAYVQGKRFMEPYGGLFTYRERPLPQVPLVRTAYRMVKVDTSKCEMDQTCGVCKACRCYYKCNCDDYVRDHQNCQHCHWLAMWSSARRTALFNTPPEASQFDIHRTDSRYISSDLTEDRRFALELQHEMSYNLSTSFLSRDLSNGEWHFRNNITVIRVQERGMCRCGRISILQQGKSCSRCKICVHQYKCNCEDADFAICRHVHYVARDIKLLNELPLDRFIYLQQILFKQYPVQVAPKYGPCLRPPRPPNTSHEIATRQFRRLMRT